VRSQTQPKRLYLWTALAIFAAFCLLLAVLFGYPPVWLRYTVIIAAALTSLRQHWTSRQRERRRAKSKLLGLQKAR